MAIRGTTELEKVGAHECEHVYSIHGLTHTHSHTLNVLDVDIHALKPGF